KHVPTSDEYGSTWAMEAPNDGYLYVTGRYSGSANFDTVMRYSGGIADFFVAKYDTEGNLIWVRDASGHGFEDGAAIAVYQGEVYIGGRFRGTTTIGPVTFYPANGSDNIFIAKYASDGTFLWAKQIGGREDDAISDITVDDEGNLYLIGS